MPEWLRAALRRLNAVEVRGRDSLGEFLRHAVADQLHDEHRTLPKRDDTITADASRRYRAALGALTAADQQLIVAYVELGFTNEQIGCMLDKSPAAARAAVLRAMDRLATAMDDE